VCGVERGTTRFRLRALGFAMDLERFEMRRGVEYVHEQVFYISSSYYFLIFHFKD
jgi:hypothetical protein